MVVCSLGSYHLVSLRCSAIIVQGFDDCPSVQSVFKLLDSFDMLIYRDGIRAQVERKYTQLFRMFSEDLDRAYKIFTQRRDSPPIFDNMPLVAGSLTWCRGLRERIMEPYKKIMAVCLLPSLFTWVSVCSYLGV